MKITKLTLVILILTKALLAQTISWVNINSKYNLPNGIQIFEGTRQVPLLKIYYIDADLNNPKLSIRPYLSSTNLSVDVFNDKVGAYASINGGYFGGSEAYSAVIIPDEILAANVSVVSRNSKSYPLVRSLFSMNSDGTFSVDWIYHFGSTLNDIYKYTSPLPYINNDPTPLPSPSITRGEKKNNIFTGIGGAPVLIKDGKINITYNEEVMWGSGVGFDNRDPRTAIGYTKNKHIIMLVADGRGTQSDGVGLSELAQIMFDLGCYEAMNLDGGGSTQLAVGKSYVNTPAGIRPVPVIFSVVNSDSVRSKTKPVFEKIIDTEDLSVTKIGAWFETANSGYYGASKSLLIARGTGANYIKYKLSLPVEKKYDVFAWWVAASNRCTNTPYIISSKGKNDTIRVDQTKNGSTWQKLGTFTFTTDSTSSVVVRDAALNGTYVTADAVRIISFDNITKLDNEVKHLPSEIALMQNYPNPFNPITSIEIKLPIKTKIKLLVYDVMGRLVEKIVDQEFEAGDYNFQFNGYNLSSGIYFYQLKSGSYSETKKMILMK